MNYIQVSGSGLALLFPFRFPDDSDTQAGLSTRIELKMQVFLIANAMFFMSQPSNHLNLALEEVKSFWLHEVEGKWFHQAFLGALSRPGEDLVSLSAVVSRSLGNFESTGTNPAHRAPQRYPASRGRGRRSKKMTTEFSKDGMDQLGRQ